MSVENAKKFYQTIASDENLRTRLVELNKQYQGEALDDAKKAELIEKVILPIAVEKGLPFTMEDLKQYEKEMVQTNQNGELSSDELDAVSGGIAFLSGGLCVIVGAAGIAGLGLCFVFGI